MNQNEGIEILETIQEVYPKFHLTKQKANMLLEVLVKMDYHLVREKLIHHVATHPYAPTIEEIAAYKPAENDSLQLMHTWEREAAMVSADVKAAFYEKMNAVLTTKAAGGNTDDIPLTAGKGKEDNDGIHD